MIEFSVIMTTYNSGLKQIKRTLESIIQQKDIVYEIIVCDDCSRENHFQEIREILVEGGVQEQQYLLLEGKVNQGTVRNVLKGLNRASGTYAKLIGAGDMLYHEHTLRDIYDFMEENQAQGCFGIMRGFREKNGEMEYVLHASPRDIKAYRMQDEEKIVKNLMLCEDWVSGAGIFARTEYYKKYISMLEGKVLYCEDWATALSAVDHAFLKLFDQYAIWYEVGDGISTSTNTEFRKKLLEDNRQFWKLFDEYCEAYDDKKYGKYIRKRRRKKKLEHISSNLIKIIYKSIVNPDMVLYEMDVRKQKEQGMHLPKVKCTGFLDKES